MATLSILGLYNYDSSIFDDLRLPPGIDSYTLVGNLLAELAEFEIIYPNATFMRKLIGLWSNAHYENWKKLYESTQFEYDPISNYDRKEEETNAVNNTANFTSKGSNSNVSKVAAFNETALQPSESNEGDSSTTGSSNANTDATRKLRAYGNIGVTTTQQMIEEERGIVKFNIYDYIIDSFKKRFCILVY